MLDLALWQQRFGEYVLLRQQSKGTVDTYQRGLKPFFAFLNSQGIDSLNQVNRDTLEDYRSHIFTIRSPQGRLWSATTQKSRLAIVKSFFRYLSQTGYLLVNVSAYLDLPKVHRPLPAVLSESETLKCACQPLYRQKSPDCWGRQLPDQRRLSYNSQKLGWA